VYGTGVDDAGLVLAPGAQDPHWQVVSGPVGRFFEAPGAAIVKQTHPSYFPANPVGEPGSCWIGPSSDSNSRDSAGDFVFRTTFDLTDFDPATARISGRLGVDNSIVDVRVNGVSQGALGGGFKQWRDFEIAGGMVNGVNVLDLVVRNFLPSPMALRVELRVDADPLPTAIPVDVLVRASGQGTLNAASHGRLQAAVLGSDELDVTTVLPASVTLAGAPVARCGNDAMTQLADVDGDGLLDLVLWFETTELAVPDAVDGAVTLPLTGRTAAGLDIVGAGSIAVTAFGGFREYVTAALGGWPARGDTTARAAVDRQALLSAWRASRPRRER